MLLIILFLLSTIIGSQACNQPPPPPATEPDFVTDLRAQSGEIFLPADSEIFI